MKAFIEFLLSLFSKKESTPEPQPAPEPEPPAPVAPAEPAPEARPAPTLAEELVDEAKKYVGVREKGGANKGPEVENFQKAVDGKAQGESWCMAFVQYCIKEVETRHSKKSLLEKSEHCMTVWNKSPIACRISEPEAGCLIVWNYVGTASGHVGIVTRVDGEDIHTIEGNTGDGSGVVREGDGVYERTRLKKGTSKMRVVGFLKVF